jgi:hypothetical protein
MDDHPRMDVGKNKFLLAIQKAHSKSALSSQLAFYYGEENRLRQRFAKKEGPYDPYSFLIPVFHPQIERLGVNKTRARKVNDVPFEEMHKQNPWEQEYLCALTPERRRKDGEDGFVQGGMAGFKRSWDIFTEGALETINWYFGVFAL